MENKQRKGAWTKEEDTLLRNCIDKFGEGKWHKIPLRAGLKRCRKSCRLRWLNYLRPNIKRGYFTKDEVDLIIRLHKLLGNRWSLIAGRLPGRTANDVKNFWNTHILKKSGKKSTETKIISEKNDILFKPRPWRFPKSHVPSEDENKASESESESLPQDDGVEFPLTEEEVDECIRCWLQTETETEGEPNAFSPTQINHKVTEFTSVLLDADFLDLTIFD